MGYHLPTIYYTNLISMHPNFSAQFFFFFAGMLGGDLFEPSHLELSVTRKVNKLFAAVMATSLGDVSLYIIKMYHVTP